MLFKLKIWLTETSKYKILVIKIILFLDKLCSKYKCNLVIHLKIESLKNKELIKFIKKIFFIAKRIYYEEVF